MTLGVSGIRAVGGFVRGQDGRGAPPPSRPRFFGGGFVIFFLLLLLFNIVVTSTLQTQPTRVRIPYSPTFLAQVNAGNVSAISSKGTTVQGLFRTPCNTRRTAAPPATLFVTEIPEFANGKALMALLQSKGVVINATSPSSGASTLVTLLFTLGPLLLFVLAFVWLMRAPRPRHGGASGARGPSGSSQPISTSTSTTSPASTRPRRS